MAEINISYAANPKGQVGPRPQPIKKGELCTFVLLDTGTLEIEFIDGSPATNGQRKFKQGDSFTAIDPGPGRQLLLRFKCTMNRPGPDGKVEVVVADPNDPSSGGGGEIIIGA